MNAMNEQNIAELDNSSEIDALLGDIDSLIAEAEGAGLITEDEIVEEPIVEHAASGEVSTAVVDDALRDLEIMEAKSAAYAEQHDDGDLNTELPEPSAVVEVAAEPEVVEIKAADPEKPKRQRVSSEGKKKSEIIGTTLGANSHEYFVLEADDAELDEAGLKEHERKVLEVVDALPKKVGEKATNIFSFLKTGDGLSIFTRIALNILIEKGTFTSEDLRNKMLAEGYSQGTSNSQAQQMMQLLPALKIGVRVKNLMTKNPDSVILAKYELVKNSMTKPASA